MQNSRQRLGWFRRASSQQKANSLLETAPISLGIISPLDLAEIQARSAGDDRICFELLNGPLYVSHPGLRNENRSQLYDPGSSHSNNGPASLQEMGISDTAVGLQDVIAPGRPASSSRFSSRRPTGQARNAAMSKFTFSIRKSRYRLSATCIAWPRR
jgi:hypothetical protein